MQQLWESEARRENRLNIPEPLLYKADHRMLWQMGVPGLMLGELCSEETLFLDSISKTAEQISWLHQVPLEHRQQNHLNYLYRGKKDLLQELEKVDQQLNKFNAPHRENIKQLIIKLVKLFPSIKSVQKATLHGDLHLKNILVDGDRVYLIDLDAINSGNPLQDIGSFIAAIINLGLIGSLSMHLVEQTIGLFLHTYCKTVPWSGKQTELRWHIATALVTERIFRSFTRLKAGRMENIEYLLMQAEMLLDKSYTPKWL
jgi:Ser/Thr protein kinase RdoA (MazF antagonist)